jgi:hypothetical protein
MIQTPLDLPNPIPRPGKFRFLVSGVYNVKSILILFIFIASESSFSKINIFYV